MTEPRAQADAATAAAPPSTATARERPAENAEVFSGRVVGLFLTQVLHAAIGVVNGLLIARQIGPAGRGEYYLLILLPTTVMVLVQLGLPQAIAFYSAKGHVRGLLGKSVILTIALASPAMLIVLLAVPWLQTTILSGLDASAILVGLGALPLLLSATLTAGLIVGRQAVTELAIVQIAYALSATVLIVVLVGVLDLGVAGALIAFLATSLVETVGLFVGARRVSRRVSDPQDVSFRSLFAYGLRLYPGSLTRFFGYRVDVYLLAWLLADPAAPLGYYAIAVTMAELVFFLPDAVSSLLFSQVAGSAREDVDRELPRASRVTLLVTAAAALALVPVSAVLIHLLLPAFTASLPVLYILLPGVVMISSTKVFAGYLAGLGHATLTSALHIVAFVVNVVANLLLIPSFGILGAAAASLISYSVSSLLFSLACRRIGGASLRTLWIPRLCDVRFATAMTVTLARRVSVAVARAPRRGPRTQD